MYICLHVCWSLQRTPTGCACKLALVVVDAWLKQYELTHLPIYLSIHTYLCVPFFYAPRIQCYSTR